MIRFYFDAHIADAVRDELRRRGVDVQTSVEAGLRTASDEAHLAHACREERVLVTGDRDFLRLHARGLPHCGIVFIRQTRDVALIIRALLLVHGAETTDGIRGRVEYQ